jgi:hypothetical protein
VLRRGKIKELAVQLDAPPADLNPVNINDPQRLQPADDYWTAEFLPMLQERMF